MSSKSPENNIASTRKARPACQFFTSLFVWMHFSLHSVVGHNYAVACKTPLNLSGHRGYQYQTVLGSGEVKLRRNQDVLACGSKLIWGETLGIDVQNIDPGGMSRHFANEDILRIPFVDLVCIFSSEQLLNEHDLMQATSSLKFMEQRS
jgi:hypothetical protein